MKDFSDEIFAYALKNALEYGKADPGKILPKLFQHGLDKKSIKEIMPKIQEIIKEVNSLNHEQIEKELKEYAKYIPEKEEKEKTLPELPNPVSDMVFRLAPFPSGALHIGNAKTYLLNALYAEKYKAKTLFVVDDTIGSEEKQIAPEAYDLLKEAFDWLSVKYEKPIIYKSDRLEIYYEYAEKLIEKDKAYVCHCSQDELRKNRLDGIDCKHRNVPTNKQINEWKNMFNEKEGSAVLRLKTSMQNPNPAFRDRVLFKISDRKHPKVGNKYRIWPTLEMSWAIDDHLLGITHILRGNDLMIETEMEKYIWNIFSWKYCETIHTGLIRIEGIEGTKISKSKAQKEVKSGEFIGWDDPRTWSIQSLRRRGIKPEAIREFVEEIGLTNHDIAVPIDSLYAINRKIIDPTAERFSFVNSQIKLDIKNMPIVKEVSVKIHPDKKEERKIAIGKEIFISGSDFESLKGKEIRLLHLFNMNLQSQSKAEFTSIDNKDIPKINWVSEGVKCKILMPNGSWTSGLAEKAIESLNVSDMIQFERFGFCRLDKKSKKEYEFWFAHK